MKHLKCWQLAFKLKNVIKTEVLPILLNSEKVELKSQLTRAARSGTSTIAEGWGRFHSLDSNRFYFNARGSDSEGLDHLIEAREEGSIPEDFYTSLRFDVT